MDGNPFVQGVPLRRLARADGPFASAFLSLRAGRPIGVDELSEQLETAPGPLRTRLLEAVDVRRDRPEVEAMAFVVSESESASFEFSEPIRRQICRLGRFPSLGSVLEQHQLVVSHVMVTVEDGSYGVTAFGSRSVPDSDGRSLGVTGSVETVVEELGFAPPRLLALAGTERQISTLDGELRDAFPEMRIVHYQVEDLDHGLGDLAEQLVRDAATVAAEDVAHELGAFRAAAAEGLAVQGEAVIEALMSRELAAVLVHDDVDDLRPYAGDRLVDAVVATAIGDGVRVTMIPDVDERRGPDGGLGGIVGRPPLDVSVEVDPAKVIAAHRPLSGPADSKLRAPA